MTYQDLAVTAAQGIDTEDFLRHIAWTDVLKPRFEQERQVLTDRLVQSVLKPNDPTAESREQIAGKLWGLDHAVKLIEGTVKKGRLASAELAKSNIALQ